VNKLHLLLIIFYYFFIKLFKFRGFWLAVIHPSNNFLAALNPRSIGARAVETTAFLAYKLN
jgi:hypothetical protein